MAEPLIGPTVPAESFQKILASKFYGYLVPAATVGEAETTLKEYQARYADATHVCYAFRIGLQGEHYRYSDAGEPKNTAGLPIYNALRSAGVSNAICMVVRYYGGTKLGTSGLIEAYRDVAAEAVSLATLEPIIDRVQVAFACRYPALPDLYLFLKRNNLQPAHQDLAEQARILVWLERERLSILSGADLDYKGIKFEVMQ